MAQTPEILDAEPRTPGSPGEPVVDDEDTIYELLTRLQEGDPEFGGENYSRQILLETAVRMYVQDEKDPDFIVDVVRNMAQLRINRQAEIRGPFRETCQRLIDMMEGGSKLSVITEYFPQFLDDKVEFELTVDHVAAILIKSEEERLEETKEAREVLANEFLAKYEGLSRSPTFRTFVEKVSKFVVYGVNCRSNVEAQLDLLSDLVSGKEVEGRGIFRYEDKEVPEKIVQELA